MDFPLNPVYIYIQIWSSLTNTEIRDFPALAEQLNEPQYLFQTFSKDTAADLHHQYYLRIQPPTAKCKTDQIRISNGRQPAEDAVSGHDGVLSESESDAGWSEV